MPSLEVRNENIRYKHHLGNVVRMVTYFLVFLPVQIKFEYSIRSGEFL